MILISTKIHFRLILELCISEYNIIIPIIMNSNCVSIINYFSVRLHEKYLS